MGIADHAMGVGIFRELEEASRYLKRENEDSIHDSETTLNCGVTLVGAGGKIDPADENECMIWYARVRIYNSKTDFWFNCSRIELTSLLSSRK